MKMKVLDVGCGGLPKGDVNCDLFLDKTPHSKWGLIKHNKNFVKCDAQALPFKDSSFLIIHASHIMEHLPSPEAFVKESKRVTTKYLYIQVPSLNFVANNIIDMESSMHLYTWSKLSLLNLLKRHFPNVSVYESQYSRPGTPVIRGRILKRFGVIGKIIGLILKQFYCTELTAICKKE